MSTKTHRYEITGITLSILIMVAVLVFLTVKEEKGEDAPSEDNVETVEVRAEGDVSPEAARANALIQASNGSDGLTQLVLEDLQVGTGESVEVGDVVTTHYIGRTSDGLEFDNSYEKGQPFTFKVGDGRVIDGWEQGLIGMKVGGQRILIIPSEMGYGNRQIGPIPANSVLVFIVELLAIQ